VAGLALFNRTGPTVAFTPRVTGAFLLHQTGDPGEDSVFIEHSSPLLARGHEWLLRPMLATALRHGRVVLGGVSDEVRRQVAPVSRGRLTHTRTAPFVALHGRTEAGWLAELSGSTRYHLRRSWRSYEQGGGTLMVRQAADVAEGLRFLDALAALHQASWIARGHPGAFAQPAFRAFHRALVQRGLPQGEVELLRISVVGNTHTQIIGYLYNLRWRDRLYSYQSGFDYPGAAVHQSPGLTCHHAAIAAAIASGARSYDFMAGAARYKTSLSNAAVDLHWLDLARPAMLHGLLQRWRHIRDADHRPVLSRAGAR
jgi:CelD/BcsL family acetyltransferase involved in cellulose biosynthesis